MSHTRNRKIRLKIELWENLHRIVEQKILEDSKSLEALVKEVPLETEHRQRLLAKINAGWACYHAAAMETRIINGIF